jgi:hypothetical protein
MTVLARLPSSLLGPWSGQGQRPRLPFPRIQGVSRGRVLLSWRTFTMSRPLQPGIGMTSAVKSSRKNSQSGFFMVMSSR